MRLQPIIYVDDMQRAIAWYSVVLGRQPVTASSHWTSFAVEGGNLALHLGPGTSGGRVELSLVVDEPLETLEERLSAGGISTVRGVADEAFGRSLLLADPDGTHIQVNEHDPDLYPD
ncbi:MAG: VOC family protein [Acidimicrobiia bacterium]|nr:VOC family protein [Acidimicrobiia bacterium]MDH4309724.1 VOC family protein [Acidimicrobiia bacterium]